MEEASKKSGLKGEASIDWKIFFAGVEKSSESEAKSSSGVEVEWTVKVGMGSSLARLRGGRDASRRIQFGIQTSTRSAHIRHRH